MAKFKIFELYRNFFFVQNNSCYYWQMTVLPYVTHVIFEYSAFIVVIMTFPKRIILNDFICAFGYFI